MSTTHSPHPPHRPVSLAFRQRLSYTWLASLTASLRHTIAHLTLQSYRKPSPRTSIIDLLPPMRESVWNSHFMLIYRIGPSHLIWRVSIFWNCRPLLDPRLIYLDADLLHHTEPSNSKQLIGKYDIFIAPQLPAPTTSKLAHVQLGDDRSIVLTLREWTSCKRIDCGHLHMTISLLTNRHL